jgi:hypothetical protein
MQLRYFALALLLGACFNPDISQVTFTCAAGQPDNCPEGQVCENGTCTTPSLADLGAVVLDMAARIADLAQPSGCRSGSGKPVGSAWACPGSFNPGEAAKLCASGYALCTSAAGIDAATCSAQEGFFLANVVGRYFTRGDLTGVNCTSNDFYRVLYGCGNPIKARTAATPCGSFYQLVDCQDPSADFRCPAGPFTTIDNVTNPYPLDGVLCCKA